MSRKPFFAGAALFWDRTKPLDWDAAEEMLKGGDYSRMEWPTTADQLLIKLDLLRDAVEGDGPTQSEIYEVPGTQLNTLVTGGMTSCGDPTDVYGAVCALDEVHLYVFDEKFWSVLGFL